MEGNGNVKIDWNAVPVPYVLCPLWQQHTEQPRIIVQEHSPHSQVVSEI